MQELRPRLLVVDDEPANIDLVADIFSDYNVLFATNGEQALQIAANEKPDLILLDILMPGIDGYEVCRRLKDDSATQAIPVIFISVLGDAAAETRGLELGAIDYVSKPFSPMAVRMRVQNQIELKRIREQLTSLSLTDALTAVPNRRHFDNVLLREHARHIRTGREMSLLLIDIDHFKSFNDRHGHLGGDDCLQQVARALSGMVRTTDLMARYGGEEFVCILPETGQDGALVIAEKMRTAIAALAIHLDGRESDTDNRVTISVGVTTGYCLQGRSPLMFVAKADELLYAAKSDGRNRVCAYTIPPEVDRTDFHGRP